MNIVSPVFLLGTQRSGTTLLTRILSSHSTFHMQNELPMEGIFTLPLDKKTIVERITSKINRLHGKALAVESNQNSWGLKDPLLTNHLPELAKFFPESKYILIVRDGRGVVNSYIENQWGLGTNVFTGSLRWVKEINQQTDFMSHFSENAMTLRYEDLIENLPVILPKICDFIGIKFESNMLNYYKNNADFNLNKENRHTNKAPDSSLAEKWKQKLTLRQVKIINSIAHEELKRYQYDISQGKINITTLEIIYYKIHQKIIGEFQLQYQLKLKSKLKKLNLIK